MSVFCLVHGSVHGADGWALVKEALEKRGHEVFCPELPNDRPEAGSAYYAGAIVEAIDRSGHDRGIVELVGHSSAGLYVPLAARERPPKRLTFLAAVVPEIGASLRQQARRDPSMFAPGWLGRDPREEAVAREFLLHDCNADSAAWALDRIRVHLATGVLDEICPLDAWPTVPVRFLVCREDRTISPEWMRRVSRERLQVEPEEIPGGHCPQFCRPRELAAALEARIA